MRLGRRLDALLEHLGEVSPLLERRVDAVEVRERIGVERLDAEHVAVRLFGLGDVAELFFERARQATTDHPLHLRILVHTEHVGVGVGELLPAAVDQARQALDLLTRLLVERALP